MARGSLAAEEQTSSALSGLRAQNAELQGELERASGALESQADKLAAVEEELAAAQAALAAQEAAAGAKEEALAQAQRQVFELERAQTALAEEMTQLNEEHQAAMERLVMEKEELLCWQSEQGRPPPPFLSCLIPMCSMSLWMCCIFYCSSAFILCPFSEDI